MTDTFKKLDFVINETNEIMVFYDQSKRNNILIFCMTMLERLKACAESLNILLADSANYHKVEYSCGIIIRSFLLDHLIVLNAADIFWKYQNERILKDKLDEFCLMMLTDSVKYTIENVKLLNAHSIISNESMTKIYSNLIGEHENCFEKEYNLNEEPVLLYKEKIKKSRELFESILKSDIVKDFESVFEAYLFYSKYDHFGQMSYSIQRISVQDRISQIQKVIDHFPHMIRFIIAVVAPVTTVENKSFLVEKAKSVVDFINEN